MDGVLAFREPEPEGEEPETEEPLFVIAPLAAGPAGELVLKSALCNWRRL